MKRRRMVRDMNSPLPLGFASVRYRTSRRVPHAANPPKGPPHLLALSDKKRCFAIVSPKKSPIRLHTLTFQYGMKGWIPPTHKPELPIRFAQNLRWLGERDEEGRML